MLATKDEAREGVKRELRGWLADREFPHASQEAWAVAAKISPARLSKLINGKQGIALDRETLSRIAAAAGREAAPLLRAAGFVVDRPDIGLPATLVDVLTGWEPWELELLAEELGDFRRIIRRAAGALQAHNNIGQMTEPLVTANTGRTAPRARLSGHVSQGVKEHAATSPEQGGREAALDAGPNGIEYDWGTIVGLEPREGDSGA